MHLISPLAAGVAACPNGYARLFRRGTATRATWYASFEADQADSSGADIPLDSTGSVIAYVNELVQVQVFDSLGEKLRDFISGDQAYAVEVISQSFTGTDYTSGAQGVSKPTTDGIVLDRWLTSAGGIDWEGLYSGSSSPLKNIFGAIYGMFFNVKSPEFGAVGDGTTNDAAAIQAAYTAAAAAGGGVVVFPPGVYNHSAEFTCSTGVSTFGVPGTVTLRCTTAAQCSLRYQTVLASGPDTPTVVYGMRFESTVTNSATQVLIGYAGGDEIHVIGCRFGGNVNATGAGIVFGGTMDYRAVIRDCDFHQQTATNAVRDTSSAGLGRVSIENCRFWTPTAAYDESLVMMDENPFQVKGCDFRFTATSGTPVGIEQDGTAVLRVSGCTFAYVSGPACYAIELFDGAEAYVDDDNAFTGSISSMLLYRMTTGEHLAVNTSYLTMRRYTNKASSATTDSLDPGFVTYNIRSTNDGTVSTPSFEMPYIYYAGQEVNIIIGNFSGTNWTGLAQLTYDTGHIVNTRSTTPWPAINNSARISLRFVSSNVSSSWDWIQVCDTQAAEF